MRLRWSTRSPFVRKVMVCAHEMGLVDRLELVPTTVVMGEPHLDLMQTNPLGRIPTLETDDGQILYDSVVICEYLDTLHKGESFFPRDLTRRWQVLTRHALATGMLETGVLWRNESIQPEPQRSAKFLAAFELKMRTAIPALERDVEILSSTPIDISHVSVACALGYLDFRFAEFGWRQGHDRLTAWYETFLKRPSMQATMPVDNRPKT
jgi:glutathione S-transferase